MPDTDFEACPVGTKESLKKMESVVLGLEKTLTDISKSKSEDAWIRGRVSLAKGVLHHVIPEFNAILKAHRERMGVEPTCKPSLQVAQSELDYTSETEDLSTWPETRGKEWRETMPGEVLNLGDVVGKDDGQLYEWVKGLAGLSVSGLSAWTRRPPQTKGDSG